MARPHEVRPGTWKVVVSCGIDPATGRQVRISKTFTARGSREAGHLADRYSVELREDYERRKHQERGESVASLRRQLDEYKRAEAARNAAEEADRGRALLAEVVARWLDHWLGKPHEATTEAGYRRLIEKHVLASELSEMEIRHVTAGDVDAWYQCVHRTARVRMRKDDQSDKSLSPASMRHIHAIVRQVFAWAVKNRYITANPAEDAELPRQEPREKSNPQVEDIKAVIAAAYTAPPKITRGTRRPQTHPMRGRVIHFKALTGLRRGEVCGLRWSKINWERQTARIDTSIYSVPGETKGEKRPKSRHVKEIVLLDKVIVLLREQWAWQAGEVERGGYFVASDADPFVWAPRPPFLSPMAPRTLSLWFELACGVVGVEGMRLHDLRHWFASTLAEQGAALTTIQAALRHESPQTTLIYLHASDDTAARREAVARLPSLELGKGTE